jgi:gliding motility-associated lipoprotein GldH
MYKSVVARVIFLCMICGAVACSFKSLYENTVDIPKGIWNKSNTVQFDVPVNDTVNAYAIIISIRNNNNYPYSNIYLFADTYSPKGDVVRDTIEFELCDSRGKWFGKGIGGLWQNQVYYRKNIRFPNSGTYRLYFTQAMRDDNLEGIMDIGIKIERNSK